MSLSRFRVTGGVGMGDLLARGVSSVAGVVFFGMGLLQMAAIVGGIAEGLGVPGLLAFLIAFVIGELPLVGTVAGIYGAIVNWGFSLLGALALFILPYVALIVATVADRDK